MIIVRNVGHTKERVTLEQSTTLLLCITDDAYKQVIIIKIILLFKINTAFDSWSKENEEVDDSESDLDCVSSLFVFKCNQFSFKWRQKKKVRKIYNLKKRLKGNLFLWIRSQLTKVEISSYF